MGKSKKKANRSKGKSNFSKIILGLIILIAVAVVIDVILFNDKIKDNNSEEVSALYEENTEPAPEEPIDIEITPTDENVILDEEPEESIEEPKENNEKKTTNSTTTASQKEIPYYIKVNYGQNVVTVYKKDDNGNYSIPIKAMVCSSGVATPKSGVYPISQKMTWGSLKGGVAGQYCTRIIKSILFHSVPYTKIYDKSSLEYWEYDKLGTKASAGCIRLTVQDAQWIFNNCVAGTKVEFYSDSNPGPLGKPSARKISDEVEVRGWDPTDPAPENPWRNYKKDDTKVDNNAIAQPEKPKENVENKVENTVANEVKNENTINNKVDNKIENTINNKVENTVENKITNEVKNTVENTTSNEVKPNNTVNTVDSKPKNTVTNKVDNTLSNEVEKVKNEIIENTIK